MADKTEIAWCSKCSRPLTDETRSGHGRQCKECRNAAVRARYVKKGPPLRFGPEPNPPRDGDKVQARQRINVEIRTGKRPHPNTLPCADCGHVWAAGERRHEYDHHLGYAAEHHLDVEPVCTVCHAKRDSAKVRQTHCIRGHEFTPENTRIAANGTRHCIACARMHEKNRAPRGSEYWKKTNTNRSHHYG